MAEFLAFLQRTGKPVLIFLGVSLLLMILLIDYAALAAASHADEQVEWCEAHPDNGGGVNGSGV